jgi:hypothetical protein
MNDLTAIDRALDKANRMSDVVIALGEELDGDTQRIAHALLAAIGPFMLLGRPDRRKLRLVLDALAHVSSAVIAANGDAAVAANDRFQHALLRQLQTIAPR